MNVLLLLAAAIAGFLLGVALAILQVAGQAKRWQAVRDDLREQRDDFRERMDKAKKRLRECEAIQAKIRGLLPEIPEARGTYTSS